MNDRKDTARKLRALAELIENPEAQADLAEAAAHEAKRRLRDGAQRLLDRFFNDTKPKR